MGNSSEWLTEFNDKLGEVTKDLSGRKNRFLQIKRLKKMAEKVDQYSNSCRDCFYFQNDLTRIVADPKNFKDILTSSNTEYEKIFSRIFRHLRKEHKLYPKFYFTSVYTLLGMLFGIMAGLLIAYMIIFIQEENSDILKTGALLGWLMGLVFGQIFGKKRDNEIKKKNQQL